MLKLHRTKANITSQTYRNSIHRPRLPHSLWGGGRIRIKLHLILQTQGSYQALDLHSTICFANTPTCAITEDEEGALHKLEPFRSRVEPSPRIEYVWAMIDGWIVVQREYRDRSYDLDKRIRLANVGATVERCATTYSLGQIDSIVLFSPVRDIPLLPPT